MAIGPRDYIDQLLVQKYNDVKADNASLAIAVEPEKMLSAMRDFSTMHRNMVGLDQRLKNFCSNLNALAINYKTSRMAAAY